MMQDRVTSMRVDACFTAIRQNLAELNAMQDSILSKLTEMQTPCENVSLLPGLRPGLHGKTPIDRSTMLGMGLCILLGLVLVSGVWKAQIRSCLAATTVMIDSALYPTPSLASASRM